MAQNYKSSLKLNQVLIFQHYILIVLSIARASAVYMVKYVIFIHRRHESIWILRSLKRYFSNPKNQYLIKVHVVLNF